MNDETIDYTESQQEVRPTLLTVMCVLTWVYGAYVLLTAPFNFFIAGDAESQNMSAYVNEVFSQALEEDPEGGEMMETLASAMNETLTNTFENVAWLATSDILGALLSSLGAFMMFRLKKRGFWIYVGTKVLGIILLLTFLGTNILTYIVVAFVIFFDLILSVLYAVNLRYMR